MAVATGYSLTGPITGNVNAQSGLYTVTLTPAGGTSSGVVITPASTLAGAFTPSAVELSTTTPSAIFYYTPTAQGTATISTTNTGALTDPTHLTYSVTPVTQPSGSSQIMSRSVLVALTNNATYASSAYSDSYLSGIFATVQDEMATELRWNPCLQVIQNEEGIVRYVTDGVYAGRYMAEMKCQPLIPGPATTIFQSLQLTYALAYSGPTNVDLGLVQLQSHNTGLIFCLGPGMVEALAGVTFSFAAPKPAVYATGYVASYCAGYSTSISDPVPSGSGSGFSATIQIAEGQIIGTTIVSAGTGFVSPPILVVTTAMGDGGNGGVIFATLSSNGSIAALGISNPGQSYFATPTLSVSTTPSFYAPLLPARYQQAALLLIRERIAYEDAMNAGMPLAIGSGPVSSVKSGVQAEAFQPMNKNLPPTTLGYGGMLSQTAARMLKRDQKRRTPDFQNA